ncbi:MAG: aminoglycoside phosphotransferase family protein [Clostridiales bacterium]|nr:aminoglycoside phosphotransferase family protein [Clostridiales bacterium]
MIDKDIENILSNFCCDGALCALETFNKGHINKTYHVCFDDCGAKNEYILQEINCNVFKNVDALMDNIFSVTDFLRKKINEEGGNENRETLHFIKTRNGSKYYTAANGNVYRLYIFVENSVSYDFGTAELLFQSGMAFGKFQRRLSDFPAENLNETIPDFHNTALRYENEFLPAVANGSLTRKNMCNNEIDFIISRKDKLPRLTKMAAAGALPVRVTHNDTKLNNVIFDKDSGEAICVIDLDTVMPGLLLYDFGDSIRFGANTAAEDEKDLSKVGISLENFEAYARGFLSQASGSLTQAESQNLAFSAWLMTMEVGMRFLTDFLNGDKYFSTAYPEHNLVRAKCQLKLALDMENNMEKMNEIISSILNA